MKRHVRLEFDSEQDFQEVNYVPFKEALDKLQKEKVTTDVTVEICELNKDGRRCDRHISVGVHKRD